MSLPIHVEAYAHYRADESPRRFELDGVEYRIYAWEREWRTPEARCFLVRSKDKRFELRYQEDQDEWLLEASYDGVEWFGRPNLEVRTLDPSVIRKVQGRILGCETCRPEDAEFPLTWLLADELGADPSVEFVLLATLVCLQCGATVTEATLVEYEGSKPDEVNS